MMGAHAFGQKHLLGMEHLTAQEITTILDLGERFLEIAERPIKKVPTLRGKTVINLFLEASTRTRTSFEIAAKRLSADGVNFTASSSSTTKGETLIDTAKNLDAMSPDIVVIRHAQAGSPLLLTKHIKAAVDHLFNYAFEQRGSDIHIEPKRQFSMIRLRIDGLLHTIYNLPIVVHPAIVSRIKTLSHQSGPPRETGRNPGLHHPGGLW